MLGKTGCEKGMYSINHCFGKVRWKANIWSFSALTET